MRYGLTDYEWAAVRPLLPNKPGGVPRVDDRRVVNGIFWVLRSGAAWRDLPENSGPIRLLIIASFADLDQSYLSGSSATSPRFWRRQGGREIAEIVGQHMNRETDGVGGECGTRQFRPRDRDSVREAWPGTGRASDKDES
jgi:hypothetical protein